MSKKGIKAWMIDNAYLMMIGCVLAMVTGCALYTQGIREAQQAGVQAAAQAPEIHETAVPVQSITPLPTIAPLAVRPALLTQKPGMWPLSGRVIRAYDAQESVYWEQLGVWQAHTGLDVAGEPGACVAACLDGTVKSAAYDALWGWRVRIAHDNERETIYAGLESCIVQPGEKVSSGQMIGTLMESIPCEAEMGTHLHLEMIREGKYQDPEATLQER